MSDYLRGIFEQQLGLSVLVANDELRINCPYCDDTKFHLYVNSRRRLFHCFKCGEAGKLKTLLDYLDIQSALFVVESLEKNEESKKVYNIANLPGGYQSVLEDGFGIKDAYAYLKSRNISDEEIKIRQIGYTHFGRFAGRIIFPIKFQGELVSYVGRSVSPSLQPKVLNPNASEAHPPAKFLYNFDQARYFDGLILTEGVFDCISTPIVNYRYAPVATFGKKLTIDQKRLIFNHRFKELIFAWDMDAKDEILKYAKDFSPMLDIKVVWFEDNKDPNDLGPDVMERLVKDAKPYTSLSSLYQISASISTLSSVSPLLSCVHSTEASYGRYSY